MGLESSWSLVDIPLDARDAAQTAARREGLSLGEWLTRRILKRYSELNSEERDDAFNQLGSRIAELADRLEQFEGRFQAEPLREAVKHLHRGLERLTQDLVQTAGHSAIQVSAVTRNLEEVIGRLDELRTQMGRTCGGFDERLTAAQDGLDTLKARQNETADAFHARFEDITQTVSDVWNRTSGNVAAIELQKAHFEQGFQTLEERLEQSGRSLGTRFEIFGGRLDEIRAESAGAVAGLNGRMAELQQGLDKLHISQSDQARSAGGKFEALRGKLDEARIEASDMCGALDQRLLLVQQRVQTLDTHQTEAANAHADSMEALTEKLEQVRVETQQRMQALDLSQSEFAKTHVGNVENLAAKVDHIHAETQHHLHALNAHQTELANAQAGNVEAVTEKVEQLRTETQQNLLALGANLAEFAKANDANAETLTEQLEQARTETQERLESMDARYGGTARTLAANIESLTGRLEESRAESSSTCTALRQSFATTQKTLEQLEQEQTGLTRNLVESRRREDAASSTVLDLQGSVSDLKSRFSELAQDNRYVALERSLTELAGRAETTESNIASLQSKTSAVDDLLKNLNERLDANAHKQDETLAELKTSLLGQTSQALSERFDAESLKQQDAIAELKTSLLGQTSQALSERFDAESRKQQDTLAELKTSLFGQTSQALSERFDAESSKQQDVFAELKASLLDQLSRTLDDRLDTDERKQSEALQQLHANLVAEALKSLGEKLEAESAKQQQAILELKASLALQPAAAPEAPQAATIENPMHTHEPEEILPPVVAPQPHADVLELDAPMNAAEPPATHDEHHVTELEPSPVVEPVFAASAAAGATVAAEPLQPAMAFAHDDASAQTAAGPAAFLSAARQSLQAASQKTDTEGKAKELFSLPFMRSGATHEKGKGETTSYALLAGVVLVAIIAVAVTAGELISRSGQSGQTAGVHPAPVITRAAKTMPAIHAAGKPATVTAANPLPAKANDGDRKRQLAVLANAGDSQAQMLLGLQQLSGPDKAKAASLLERAATSGEPVAQYRLGTLFAEGRGLPADSVKAFHWYFAAAQNGNRKAMSNLAVAYAEGTGTAKNPVEAARWFSKAAQLGLVDAQFDLAVLYERGLGVPQSLMDAYRWYLIAAKSGDKESKDRIDALASQLTPEDRSAAETAAAQFKPQPVNARANEPQ